MHLVKFVPYNEKVINSIINKTIKFSTVYEFNDFNELIYMSYEKNTDLDALVKKRLKCVLTRALLIQYTNIQTIYNTECLSKVREFLEQYNDSNNTPPKDCLNWLTEAIVFMSVGIFCLAKIDVFKDDRANLMFAHYSDNLSGLALIYKVENPSPNGCVEYEATVRISSGSSDRAIKWLHNDFTSIEDFTSKTKSWEHQKEYRLFNSPGIKKAEECKVELQAIFHTQRFDKANLETLNLINKKLYNGKLKIKKLLLNTCKYYPFMIDDTEAYEWIKKTLISNTIR